MSISSSAVNSTYGKEDWRRALEELDSLADPDFQVVEKLEEEAENYDLVETPAYLKDLNASDDTSSESSTHSETNHSAPATPTGKSKHPNWTFKD